MIDLSYSRQRDQEDRAAVWARQRRMIIPLVAAFILLVARHSGSDWLIPSQFRMGRSFGATRIWMLRATPG